MNEQLEPNHVVTINLQKVAKQSIIITVLAIVFLFAMHLFISKELAFTITLSTFFLFIIGYIVLILLHEVFHLIGFRLFGRVPWKKMLIGVNLKLGVAYATTQIPISNRAMQSALLLPFWMTGIIPAVLGLWLGNGTLLGLAGLLIGGAAGDFAMYKELKQFPSNWLIKDDPELPKLYVYEPERFHYKMPHTSE